MKRTLQRGNLTLEYEFTPKRVKNINVRPKVSRGGIRL